MGTFNKAMTSFLDADGVVIDIRGNPGGIGAMAMGMSWLARGGARSAARHDVHAG